MKLIFLSFILLITPNFAHAYLDPISISYVFTLIIGFIAFLFKYINNFFSNFIYSKKYHIINLLLINAPLLQFLSLNINKGEYINYFYLVCINLIFTGLYFIFFLVIRKFFFKNLKDILFLFSVLFLIQFQFYDIYKLSEILNIRIIFIASAIIFVFLFLFFYKKVIIQNFLSKFILIFYVFFLSSIIYNSSLIYFEIKNIKSSIKENIIYETTGVETNRKNIYFIVSDAKIDLKLFENKILKSSNNKNLLVKYKNLFENKNFIILNNARITTTDHDTATTMGSIFNLNDNLKILNFKYSRSYPTLMRFYKNTPFSKMLEEKNINFFWSGNIWNNCNIYNNNLCLKNNKKYSHLLYSSRTIFNYLSSSYLGDKIKRQFIDTYILKLIHEDLNLFDHLMNKTYPSNKELISNGNNFFFIHDWGPHPPYTYGDDCSFKAYPYGSKKGYENAYVCNLEKIYSFVDYLTKKDQNSIIIVTGDHGYWEDRRNIFRMVKLNNCKFNEREISQSFLYLVNKVVECSLKS